MKPDRLIVYRGVDGDWRWHRRNAANGRIVAVSGEGYRRRSHTIAMALALHEWATHVTVQTEGKSDLIVTRGGAE